MQIKLTVEYEGTEYCGWQIQPHQVSVQAVLEGAAARMLGLAVRMSAAGRTDAGVHAVGQVVCFPLPRASVDLERLRHGLDALTPDDVVVRAAEIVPDDFDARRSARSRTYVYRIWNQPAPSVLWRRFAWHVRTPLDVAAMQRAAEVLVGEHDFSSFRAAGCDADHPVRRVYRSDLVADGVILEYRVTATAFLRHMVRNIVGTLVEIGTGRRSATDMPSLLASRDRRLAGRTAPARGLCLVQVSYEDQNV